MGLNLDWWPTSGKWSFNGIVRTDDLMAFLFEEPIEYKAKPKPPPPIIKIPGKPVCLSPPCTLQELEEDIVDAEDIYIKGGKPTAAVFLAHLMRKRNKLTRGQRLPDDPPF